MKEQIPDWLIDARKNFRQYNRLVHILDANYDEATGKPKPGSEELCQITKANADILRKQFPDEWLD